MERKFKTGDKVVCINTDGLTSPLHLSAGKEYTLEYACAHYVTVEGVKGDYFLQRFKLVEKSSQQIYDEACAIASTINHLAIKSNEAVMKAWNDLTGERMDLVIAKQSIVVNDLLKEVKTAENKCNGLKTSLKYEEDILKTLQSKQLAFHIASHM